MKFKINEGLFYIDGFYYLIDKLRSSEIGKYHLILDTITNEHKIDLLTKSNLLDRNIINMGLVIASNKFLIETPYIDLPIFLDDIEEVEIKTFGLGIFGEKAYQIDLSDNNGNQQVILLNYKKINK